MNPTKELYNAIQMLYNHFNETLFDYSLPPVLFTNQRQVGIMGYFSANRWASSEGKRCHEIAINPVYVGRATLIELMQTLVHEMVHCWQECHGTPSRKGYHNREWSNKMIAIGLMPSATGRPSGALVGQSMSDYPAPNGKFIYSCEKLLKENVFSLPWIDRFALSGDRQLKNEELAMGAFPEDSPVYEAISNIDDILTVAQLTSPIEISFGENAFVMQDQYANQKVKSKYTCPDCEINAWGKPGLNLRCGDCNFLLIEN